MKSEELSAFVVEGVIIMTVGSVGIVLNIIRLQKYFCFPKFDTIILTIYFHLKSISLKIFTPLKYFLFCQSETSENFLQVSPWKKNKKELRGQDKRKADNHVPKAFNESFLPVHVLLRPFKIIFCRKLTISLSAY